MWSFDGDYKKKPKQSLGGATRTLLDRGAFLNKLKSDREEREEQRRREAATLKIQSWVRGAMCRLKTRRKLRLICDDTINKAKCEGASEEVLEKIIALLIRIFNPKYDTQRLLNTCQLVVREQKIVSEWVCRSLSKWSYLLPRLVCMSLSVIADTRTGNSTVPHATPLRLLEIVTTPESWAAKLSTQDEQNFLSTVLSFLIKNGFYKHLVQLLLTKVPEVYESTTIPPVPLAESLLTLFMRPLLVSNLMKKPKEFSVLLNELCKHIFGAAVNTQIRNFLLPAIALRGLGGALSVEGLLNHLAQENSAHLLYSQPAPAVLYSLTYLIQYKDDFREAQSLSSYLKVVSELVGRASSYLGNESEIDDDSDDEDEDREVMDTTEHINPQLRMMAEECMASINLMEHVTWLLNQVEHQVTPEVLLYLSRLIHHLLTAPSFKLHQCRLLYSLVARKQLVRSLWICLSGLHHGAKLPTQLNMQYRSSDGSGTPLLQVLARGYPLSYDERNTLVPLLATFCATLTAIISTLHDSEFITESDSSIKNLLHPNNENNKHFPFTTDEIIMMSATLRDVCVGLAELAHPDARMSALLDTSYRNMWAHCFKVCVSVVRQIHLRDTRRNFCPDGHWLSSLVFLPVNNSSPAIVFIPRNLRRLFMPQRWLTREGLELEGPPLSIQDQRRATLLQELPFVFVFESRMQVFSTLIANDRNSTQYQADFNVGPFIKVTIRRTHIYEDAFDKLSTTNEPNLRLRMRVRLMNTVGTDEVGIDGGGIFREFLSELLKTAFDPNRGFFLTTRDNTLYPNPGAHLINSDYQNHYYFIGRMLGKALYENLLVEVPLAGFFLSKLLSKSSSVEFHHLDSLDPELCRNLLFLKTYEGDVQDLGLDFTVLTSDLGQNCVEELIADGANIPVTSENRIEYIYRMADYKLNKQIAKQCQAFRKGVMDVVTSEWLQMFDWRELQMLVSGAAVPIDTNDLANNTKYGGYYDQQHQTIAAFWRVVAQFDDLEKRQLLKFVTSCSRPPLLGFKDLHPSFCIQPSGKEDRLPTASTCMNLLKLPEYHDDGTLKEKLLYAITSGAGFELS